jgi:hypothetical protein
MSAMKRVFSLFFAISLLTVVASCVDSRNPASDEKTSKIDERLIGNWKEGDNKDLWKVEKSKDVENALVVTIPDPNGSNTMPAFCTTIKSKSYLSVRDESDAKEKDRKAVKYDIYQCEFSDNDTLVVRGMYSEAIVKAIQAKQLIGTVEKDDEGEETPEITDTTEGILRYLEAHADECYSDKSDQGLNFKRQK